jgi:type VI protein secretion system component VasA
MFRERFELEADALWAHLRRLAEATPRLQPLYTRNADARVARLVQSAAYAFADAAGRLEDDGQVLVRPLVASALPESLRPRPSSTILEISAAAGRTGQVLGVSFAGRASDTSLPFEVVWPVTVAPLERKDVRIDRVHSGLQVLRLTLVGRAGVALGNVLPDRLRFFADLEPRTVALDLLLSLRRANDPIVARGFDPRGELVAETTLPRGVFAWVQVDTDEPPLVSAATDRFRSSSLLRDLFAFPESFCFFELDFAALLRRKVARLELSLPLGHVVEAASHLTDQHLRLFCAPATNQYVGSIEPLSTTSAEAHWPLVVARRPHAEILEVRSLYTQSARDSGRRIELLSWDSPESPHTFERDDTYYMLEQTSAPSEPRTELHVSFATLEQFGVAPPGSVVQGEVLASDGALTGGLGLGDVGAAREGAVNITRITPSSRAPMGQNHGWRMSAYARMPPIRLADSMRLAEFVRLHEHPHLQDAGVRIGLPTLLSTHHRREHLLMDGVLCWGDVLTVDTDTAACNDGEVWLLGALLQRALAERNERLRFSRLVLRKGGEVFADYGPRFGERLPFPLG